MAQNAAAMKRIESRSVRTQDRHEKRREERAATINRRAIRKTLRIMIEQGEVA